MNDDGWMDGDDDGDDGDDGGACVLGCVWGVYVLWCWVYDVG